MAAVRGQSDAAPPRVLSGITPSGSLTLGNYLGALKRFVDGQDHQRGFFFVADLHALTTEHEPDEARRLTRETALLFFAAGLDAARSTVFVQSHVSEHVELSYLLESTAYVGELGRMIQFKEKGGRPKTRASLFTYPCLMAADILLYDTVSVPVGGDQDQHVELCRDLAMRFNSRYGETFVVPEPAPAALAARVVDLASPTVKMSKSAPGSAAGVVRLLDSPDVVRRKIIRAVTDSDGEVRYDPATKPGVSNLLDIIACISGDTTSQVASRVSSYGALKVACVEEVVGALRPIQERYADLAADPATLSSLLRRGADRAREAAGPVLVRAREAIGLS
ncbi:MAG: tryptophan--tRNA ligase [Propionibacteriales bacterium]|nr:tryptophan--tRNA ligase [Propionibacteriales bacterium]